MLKKKFVDEDIRDAVATPPSIPERSNNIVLAPLLPAVTAAATPDNPAPTTMTSN